LRFPRPCRRVMWRITLARRIAVSKATAKDLRHNGGEAVGIGLLAFALPAIVITNYLFVNVARDMNGSTAT
jgi:hypothetical protein